MTTIPQVARLVLGLATLALFGWWLFRALADELVAGPITLGLLFPRTNEAQLSAIDVSYDVAFIATALLIMGGALMLHRAIYRKDS